MTLTELVEEYLDLHLAEPVTIAKLRWLLGKATVTLGEARLAELSQKDVHAWHTKTRLSNRAVPLQAKALEALDRLPRSESEILFPNSRGGRIDFRSVGRRHWKPAQRAACIEPLRDLYDLRHTYATFALRAGVPVFAVSRFMGSSIAMIDHHYGHLAHDSREHAVSLLDALALERAVDAGWTPARTTAKPHPTSLSGPPRLRSRRAVNARWTSGPRLVAATASKNS
jgi:integrase